MHYRNVVLVHQFHNSRNDDNNKTIFQEYDLEWKLINFSS